MTKEEAYRYIDNLKWLKGYDNTTISGKTVGEILDEIKTLLKEQEVVEPKWISVNDRLPNYNGCYLVWRSRFYIDKGMPSICYFDGQNTWHDSYGIDFTRTLKPEDVSHWKPLPEQP